MMKKIFIIVLSLFLANNISYSQCSLTAFSAQDSINCGDSILIEFNAFGSLSLSDTFTTVGPSDTGWISTSGAQYDNPFIPSPTNDTYFWMGPSTTLPTALTTVSYDVSGGGQVCFDFVYAVQGGASPIEGPDEYDEGITLQYSLDGGLTWIDIVYYAPNGDTLPGNPGVNAPNVSAGTASFTSWTSVCVDIPAGAMTPSTSFQWIQENNSGNCCDHWGLDNITISSADPAYNIYMANNNSLLGPAPQQFSTYITTDSLFEFYYTAGLADTCYSSWNININPTDLGPDLLLDCNNNIVQLQATGVSLADNFSWTPTTFLSNPNIFNPTASPVDTTDYIFTSSCGSDTVTVNVVSNYIFSTSSDTSICIGETVVLEVFGGAQSFAWTPNDGSISDTSIRNPVFTPTQTTTYTVVTDSVGCIKTNDITITVSNKEFFLILPQTAGCGGASTGSLIAVASGAVGAFTYSIDDGTSITTQNNPSFTGLSAGTYIIGYTDSLNCPIDTAVVIPGGISVNIDSLVGVNPLCAGATNGSIEVFIDTNVVVDYSINGGTPQTSPIFNNLTDGTYLVNVQVGSCPPDTQTIILSAPATVSINFVDSTNLSCGNAGDGEIQVNAMNGVSPYTYSIDNINFYNNGGILGSLAAGTYTIYVMDDNGCRDSLTSSVTEPLPLIINNITPINLNCFGDNSGMISFGAMNGASPYMYSIDSGNTFVNSNSFPNLSAGTYILMAQDDNGCFSQDTIQTLTEPMPIVLVADSTLASTCGSSDGAIYVSAAGGTVNYMYSINNGPLQAQGTFIGLNSGSYNLYVIDGMGCDTSINITVVDNGAPSLTISFADSVSCNGAADASIELSATGGILPYLFSIDNGVTFVSDSIFTGLSEGLQSFIIQDSIGCQGAIDTNIYEPLALNVSTIQDSANCYAFSDGEITVSVNNGTLPYSYALNNINIVQNIGSFTGLSAGMNMVYVVDGNNCIDSLQQEVFEPDTLEILNTVAVDISCNADGSITVNAAGGTMPYTYTLNGGSSQNTNVFTITSGGNYTVGVTDANNCPVATSTDSISAPSPIVFTIDSFTSILSCNGNSNGLISVAAQGGVSPYTYSINGGAFQTDSFFNNLTAGSYIINVQDNFNCTSTPFTVTINEPLILTASTQANSVSCFGLSDGIVTINTISGGTTPYTVLINGISQTYVPNLAINSLAAGVYSIDITDFNGCTVSLSETVVDVSAINLTVNSFSNASCFGSLDAEISLTATGGSPIYTFNNGTTIISNNLSATFNNLQGSETGINYIIYVEDSNGCTDTVNQVITQPSELVIDSLSSTPISCFGYLDGLIVSHVSGGSTPYTYYWTPLGYYNSTINGVSPGTHTVTVTDANGCTASASETILNVSPIIATIIPDSAFVGMGDTVQLGVTVQNALSTNLQYSWSPTTGLSCTDCENPTATAFNDIVYTVTVTDDNDCYNYNNTEVYIYVDPSLFFFIPNGFTPNNDGLNDNFQIFGQDIRSVSMIVFNRWGEKVFEGNNQFQNWDGTFKGAEQGSGVYTYNIDIEFLNNAKINKKGSVTLVR